MERKRERERDYSKKEVYNILPLARYLQSQTLRLGFSDQFVKGHASQSVQSQRLEIFYGFIDEFVPTTSVTRFDEILVTF